MSKYRCLKCDAEFDEPIQWQEGRGVFWGDPCWETVCGCPICKGEFLTEEEYKREILGEEDEEESEDGEDEYYASLGVFDQESEDEKQ